VSRVMHVSLFVVVCCLAGYAPMALPQAGNSEIEDLESCSRLSEDARRLACFDRLAADQPSRGAEPDPTPGAAAEPAQARPQSVEAVSASEAAAATAATANREPPPRETDTESAGNRSAAAEADDTGQFTAIVSRVDTQPRGEHVVFLENGQVWQEDFASRYFPVEPGDTVTIKERFFGGHRLVTASGKGISVKRIR